MKNVIAIFTIMVPLIACGASPANLSKVADETPPAPTATHPLPVTMARMAQCKVGPDQPGARKESFDVYVGMEAGGESGNMLDEPAAVVQVGAPFLENLSLLITTARVTVDRQAKKFKTVIGDGHDAVVLSADLTEVNHAFVGTGEASLGAMGTAPMKCSLP